MGASNYHVTNSFRGSANTCIGEQKVEDNSPSQMFADPLNPSLTHRSDNSQYNI